MRMANAQSHKMLETTPFYTDRHYIQFLNCISNARVLIKPIKTNQSEGLPDPVIPEWPFVKFSHRHSFTFPCLASPLFFLLTVFHAAPQLRAHLHGKRMILVLGSS